MNLSHSKRILFIGSKALGLSILREMFAISSETLVGALTIDDSDDSRSCFNTFQSFCGEKQIELLVAKNRKASEEIIREFQPDLCIVVGWYWFISKSTLTSVPNGFIGIHNSLLPKLKGGSPLVWSILNGDPYAGFSLFSFTEGMDDGPVWAQGKVRIEHTDFIADVLNKLEVETLQVFKDVYPNLLNGSAQSKGQDPAESTFCSQRCPEDGLIDWTVPAEKIYDFIRAQSAPYPGAYTNFKENKLTIWKAKLFDLPYLGCPGQVARITDEGVYVICGDSRAIIIEEVSLDGKHGTATEYIKSITVRLSNRQPTDRG